MAGVTPPQKISIDALEKILSPSDTKYCYVLRPTQRRSEFPHHSKCDFPQMMEEVDANGIWNVVTGIDGQTDEIVYEINVEAKGKNCRQMSLCVEDYSNAFLLLRICGMVFIFYTH